MFNRFSKNKPYGKMIHRAYANEPAAHAHRAPLPPRHQHVFESSRQYYSGAPQYDNYYDSYAVSPRGAHGNSGSYYYETYDEYHDPYGAQYDRKHDYRKPKPQKPNWPRPKYGKLDKRMSISAKTAEAQQNGRSNRETEVDHEDWKLKDDAAKGADLTSQRLATPFFKKLEIQPHQNYDERTQLSDHDDFNHDSDTCGQAEILSGRGRFLSVDNVDDQKTDFGLKSNHSYDKSEKPGKMLSNFYNLGLMKDEDCQLSISAIAENKNKVQFDGQSTFEVSSSSSEKLSGGHLKYSEAEGEGEQTCNSENVNGGLGQKRAAMETDSLIEEQDIYVADPYDLNQPSTKSSTETKKADSSNLSENNCTMSSTEAQPFYPTKGAANSLSNSNGSESFSNSDVQPQSFYNQMGSVREQIQYQNKFLHSQKFKRVYKADQSGQHNPFAFKDNGRIMSKDYKIKIKTELCRTFSSEGSCPYGDTCAFAHGEHELQKKKHVPSRYKTKLCQQFHENSYCPYGNRCQFIHSTKLNEVQQKKNEDDKSDNSFDLKQFLSHRQMLNDNIECLKQRLTSSQNPYLNEFNLIYKDVITRLPIFEAITSEKLETAAASQDQHAAHHELSQEQRLKIHLEQEYAILEAKLQANLRAQAECKAKQRATLRIQAQQRPLDSTLPMGEAKIGYNEYTGSINIVQQQKYNRIVFSSSNNDY